uniref:Small ribosomal subunit protein uS3c n=1 Tax=Circaeaster agrestis TaxID=39288 RepID=A0A6M8PRH1_9MAGN|nr:ribosomal protein S3 [Circaeaster agrestis]
MGQKINPLGFRLGTTQSHHSLWFAQPKNYSEGLQEDQKIRDCIKDYLEKKSSGIKGIARIEIHKNIDLIKVIIYMGFPKLFLMNNPKDKPKIIKELESRVGKGLNNVSGNRKLNISITKIGKPYEQPNILAEFIAEQLKNRIPFRKAMKKAIELADTKGIQIQIKGRIDGKEIARVEWIREGRVPLQTIRAKIDYCSYPVQTIYGVLGIKIWIFAGED